MGVVRLGGSVVPAQRRRAVPDQGRRHLRVVRPGERARQGQAAARVVQLPTGVAAAPVSSVRTTARAASGATYPARRTARAARYTPGRPRRPGQARPRYAPVRLTRRGRLVAQLTLILAGLILVLGIAAGTWASGDRPPPRDSYPSVVVRPGDTLWNIATRHAPDANRGDTMDEIRRLNHLDGSRVDIGQRLILPPR
jgi:nucleoid-associated protein YgaU